MRVFCDVPAGGRSDHSDVVSSGMKFFQKNFHIDPVAAIYREHQNVSPIALWCEENSTYTEAHEELTNMMQKHVSWPVKDKNRCLVNIGSFFFSHE